MGKAVGYHAAKIADASEQLLSLDEIESLVRDYLADHPPPETP